MEELGTLPSDASIRRCNAACAGHLVVPCEPAKELWGAGHLCGIVATPRAPQPTVETRCPGGLPPVQLIGIACLQLGCQSVQFSSVTQSCPTLCGPMDCIACHAALTMRFSRQEY